MLCKLLQRQAKDPTSMHTSTLLVKPRAKDCFPSCSWYGPESKGAQQQLDEGYPKANVTGRRIHYVHNSIEWRCHPYMTITVATMTPVAKSGFAS